MKDEDSAEMQQFPSFADAESFCKSHILCKVSNNIIIDINNYELYIK